jgi:hypothetical protein
VGWLGGVQLDGWVGEVEWLGAVLCSCMVGWVVVE